MRIRNLTLACAAVMACLLNAPMALSQGAGGLYIAGVNFTLTQAAAQALSDNPTSGGRFFILALPPATEDLRASGPPSDVLSLRDRALARGAKFLVCRRDVQRGAVDPSALIPGVGVVWGWPSDPNAPGPGPTGLFPGETPGEFPQSADLVRRIRSTCAD